MGALFRILLTLLEVTVSNIGSELIYIARGRYYKFGHLAMQIPVFIFQENITNLFQQYKV